MEGHGLDLSGSGQAQIGRLLWTLDWNYGFHEIKGTAWAAEELFPAQEDLWSMESVDIPWIVLHVWHNKQLL